MPNPTSAEQRRLDEIEAVIADLRAQIKPLQRERDTIRSAVRMRRHRAG